MAFSGELGGLSPSLAQAQGVNSLLDPKGSSLSLSLSWPGTLGLGLVEADETGREQNQLGCRLLWSQWKKLWCELCHGFLFCCITVRIPWPCPSLAVGRMEAPRGDCGQLQLLQELWDEVGHGTGRGGSFGWLGLAPRQSLVFLALQHLFHAQLFSCCRQEQLAGWERKEKWGLQLEGFPGSLNGE